MSPFKQTSGGNSYNGVPMVAADGVHEEVGRLASELFDVSVRSNAKVLDLAAGQGALSQRLYDIGLHKVEACELDKAKFLPKLPVRTLDLNKDFANEFKTKFNLITAVEIIEHLENPFHFLRQIQALLDPQGYLILSTPNIDSALSRIQFLSNGQFRWFNDDAYNAWGHIQPISSWQLSRMTDSAGLEIIKRSHNSTDGKIAIDPGKTNMAKALMALTLRKLMKGDAVGDISVWVIRPASS